MVYFWTLKLLNRSEIDRGVVETYCANGTMLGRSAQLFVTPENHHFECSVHLKVRNDIVEMRYLVGGEGHISHY